MSNREILVVEDDQAIRDTVKEILVMSGFRVSTAGNGLLALQHLEEREEPCLILLDLMMPVMNGWQFMDTLRNCKQPSHAKIPIVVVSAISDLDLVQEKYHCGVLRKPVTIQQLLALARKHCDLC